MTPAPTRAGGGRRRRSTAYPPSAQSTTTRAPAEKRTTTSTAASRMAALSSSGPGRNVESVTPGRESTSVMLAFTCGTAWMPGAMPVKPTSMSPNAVVATSSPARAGLGSREMLDW